jgi:hypothetical protein
MTALPCIAFARRLVLLPLVFAAGQMFAMPMSDAPGAKLRLLDKLTGAVTDMDLSNGQSQSIGKLTVMLGSCRYPTGNQTAEAESYVTIVDASSTTPVFNGWMIASSPALSALDHPRYDVWVMRCDVPDLAIPDVAPDPASDPNGDPAATDSGTGQ